MRCTEILLRTRVQSQEQNYEKVCRPSIWCPPLSWLISITRSSSMWCSFSNWFAWRFSVWQQEQQELIKWEWEKPTSSRIIQSQNTWSHWHKWGVSRSVGWLAKVEYDSSTHLQGFRVGWPRSSTWVQSQRVRESCDPVLCTATLPLLWLIDFNICSRMDDAHNTSVKSKKT